MELEDFREVKIKFKEDEAFPQIMMIGLANATPPPARNRCAAYSRKYCNYGDK